MDNYVLRPVGYVRNEARQPEDIPYNGVPSRIELWEAGAAAAAGLATGYVWVVIWLHLAEPAAAREAGARGAFASRTPCRPNPVAITAARLVARDEALLHLDALDVCDGTPVLDLKPYVREFDCVFGPADPAWRRAALPEQRLARIVRTIERFCGPLTPDLALAARLAFAADRDLEVPANSADLRWECCCRHTVAAGLQAVSGAPLGGPRLLLSADEGRVSMHHADRGTVGYALGELPGNSEAVLAAPEERLFTRVSLR